MKRVLCVILLTAMLLGLCGCGSIYDKEYMAIENALPEAGSQQDESAKPGIATMAMLRSAITVLVNSGATEGTVQFSSNYEGSVSEDLASVCWQIRTGNAICAYCVENISYELSRMVSYEEAKIRISYSKYAVPVTEVKRSTYFTGVDELLLEAMQNGNNTLAVYINNSAYSAADVQELAERQYRANPWLVPLKPAIQVNLYTGSGLQKLYEVDFSYGVSNEEFQARQTQLRAFVPDYNGNVAGADEDADAVYRAYSYLLQGRELSETQEFNTVYSVLLQGTGNAEAFAYAFAYLCKLNGVSCVTVEGQKDGSTHYWNIVGVDGSYYHVDVTAALSSGDGAEGFLRGDVDMWERYRWNTAAYPECAEIGYDAQYFAEPVEIAATEHDGAPTQ